MESYVVEAFGQPLTRLVRGTPALTGTQVLVRVATCGVCHSDVHVHDGWFALGDGKRLDMSRSITLPRALGHEIAGTVQAVGPDARNIAVGDRRVVYPWIGCETCSACRAGFEQLCAAPQVIGLQHDGGFASHVVVPHPRCLVAYEPIVREQAGLYACAGVTAYSALKKVMGQTFDSKDPLLIIGAGGVGLSGIRLARHLLPDAPVLVAEADASKWQLARDTGASDVFDLRDPVAAKALFKNTGGGVARAIDFVGAGETFNAGFAALRKGGRLVSVGLFGGQATVLPVMLAMKAVSVVGSYVGTLAELHELMALARSHALPALPIHTRPLAEVSSALDDLRSGRVRGRIVLQVPEA